MKIKVITCTSDKYVGHIIEFDIRSEDIKLNDLLPIPHLTSKVFKVIRLTGKRITLQNSHVTLACKFTEK